MPHIPLCAPESAPQKSRAVYDEFYQGMGFPAPPNFILTQGHAPNVARGTWEAVRNVLVEGEIPRWIKELVFVAISHDRECAYCTAAHLACCTMLHVNPDWMGAVMRKRIDDIADAKLREMLRFSVKCSRNPQKLAPEDYGRLRAHGMSTGEIVELIGMSAFAVYANIIADSTAMSADAMFGELGTGLGDGDRDGRSILMPTKDASGKPLRA